MVGPSYLPLITLIILLTACQDSQAQSQDSSCSVFRREYCNLRLDKILMLDTALTSPSQCQTACFERKNCTEFTFFEGANSRCVLFNQCASPVSSCKSCLSGPPFPRVSNCLTVKPVGIANPRSFPNVANTERALRPRETTELPRRTEVRRTNGGSRPAPNSFQGSFRSGVSSARFGNENQILRDEEIKSQEEFDSPQDIEDYDTEEVEEEEEEEANIDDGLLDAVFDELPGTVGQTRPPPRRIPPVPQRPQRPQRPGRPTTTTVTRTQGGGFYYCIMGGSDPNGAVSSVSVMDVGTYAVPATPLISPFPSFMTKGSGSTFSTFARDNLQTCTPGYYARSLLPASTFGPLLGHKSYIAGSCNKYDFQTRQWSGNGGKMNTAREGGSTLNVGSYIMSFGGFNTFGQPVNNVEIFDPRRPLVGWQNVPQWSFPRATRDHCTVVTRGEEGPQVMVVGGLGEEVSASKLVLSSNTWYSVPPMHHARTSHGCTPVTLNGRAGVVVSGGWNVDRTNTTDSVEFFDINTHRWVDLPGLSRARRGHTMTTLDGQLAVVGGVAATGLRGEQDEYLEDVEIFDGRRWKTAQYRLDRPRTGANLIKIPFNTFSG